MEAMVEGTSTSPSRAAVRLRFERVTKFYGAVIGLNQLSCEISPGITGLLGGNGAGKSTFLRIASGLLRPNIGKATIGRHSCWSWRAKGLFGLCPDGDAFYENLTVREFLLTIARLNGYSPGEAEDRTQRCLQQVGMEANATRKLAGCSRGMRQRTKLGQALLHDPPVLLLDEPFTGIDPAGRREIGQFLQELAASGKTILLSSHILSEVEQFTDRILILARGRLIAEGTLREIRGLLAETPLKIEVEVDEPESFAAKLIQLPAVHSIQKSGNCLSIESYRAQEVYTTIADLALHEEITVRRMESVDEGADAVFRYLDRKLS